MPAPRRGNGAPTEEYYRSRGYHQIKIRLPLDAIERLQELADEGGYSRSEVIDSLIRLAWAGKAGRKLVTVTEELAAQRG